MPEVTIQNGGETGGMTEHALAELFADPRDKWQNLEIAVEFRDTYASIHWTGFTDESESIGQGFLIRFAGESPLGATESPEILTLLDGGSEPFSATARHLLDARDAGWMVWQLGRGLRPTHWPDGRPVVWSVAFADDDPWRAVGRLEEPYFEMLSALLYGHVPDDTGTPDADEPAWTGQQSVDLEARELTDSEAEALPRTAIWPVLRHLHGVTDPRWLALLSRHPMPWLRSLYTTTDELDDLPAALLHAPRLIELAIHGEPSTLPAISSDTLEELMLETGDGARLAEFLRGSRLPALRLLLLYASALAQPVDLSALRTGAVVHIEFGPDDDLGLLRNAANIRTLALALRPGHTPDALVAALAARADRDTWVSTTWDHADAAVELARARGVRLGAR